MLTTVLTLITISHFLNGCAGERGECTACPLLTCDLSIHPCTACAKLAVQRGVSLGSAVIQAEKEMKETAETTTDRNGNRNPLGATMLSAEDVKKTDDDEDDDEDDEDDEEYQK